MGLMKEVKLIGNIEIDEAVINEFTPDTGEHLLITAVTGKDIKVTLSDNAGARKLIVYDSDASEVASIDSNGVITGTVVNTPILNDADADSLKVRGLVTTRNAADSSMYIPVADTTGYERGFKICYAPAANSGGYFESAYINTKVNASMAGTVRASEHKISVTGTANASGEAVAMLAKVNVETGATVANAVGLDIDMDNDGSATVTAATAIRVDDNAKWTYGADLSGSFAKAAIKLKGGTASGIAAADVATQLACTDESASGSNGICGVYKDSGNSKIYLVIKYAGRLAAAEFTDLT